MRTRSEHPGVLDYAGDRTPAGSPRRWLLPWQAVLASLIPIVAFFVVVFTHHQWRGWFYIGQGWERLAGVLWIIAAGVSISFLFILPFCRKRWEVWMCLTLHALFVAFTVFPGYIAIPWLMHWLSGPGA